MRGVGFFLFASAYWALLPLVARNQIAGGPELYGILLGVIGAGAVGGAFALAVLKAQARARPAGGGGSLGTAVAWCCSGSRASRSRRWRRASSPELSWIAVLSSLNVSAQVALPEWVRGRGLAMFVTVFFGAMTLGSAVWGQVAGIVGLPLRISSPPPARSLRFP